MSIYTQLMFAAAFCAGSVSTAVAQTAAAPTTRSADSEWSSEDLSNAARLTVRILNQTTLSGDYRVAPDSSVSMPVLGRLSVRNKKVSDLESELGSKVAEFTQQESLVAVEIAEFKPLFVSGYVARPGPYPWQPGMMVAQCIAYAGGVYRAPETRAGPGGTEWGVLQQKSINDVAWMLANLARLKAEKIGAKEITTPAEVVTLVGAQKAEALLSSQSGILESRRAAIEVQVAALERGRALSLMELTGLKDQATRIDAQLLARRQTSAGLESLQVKGYIPVERGLEQKIKILDLEERLINISVATARVQAFSATLDRDILNVRRAHQSDVETEIVRMERELAQARIDLYSFGEKRAAVGDSPPSQKRLLYRLTRAHSAGVASTMVGEDELLRPGDVLDVSTETPSSTQ